MFASKAEAQKNGFFSRRHKTPEANEEARERYGTRKARAERRRVSAEARQAVYDAMHPHAKLASLDGRPGNSEKERARLQAVLANG